MAGDEIDRQPFIGVAFTERDEQKNADRQRKLVSTSTIPIRASLTPKWAATSPIIGCM